MKIKYDLYLASVLVNGRGLIIPCDAKSEGDVHKILNMMEEKNKISYQDRFISKISSVSRLT